MGIDPKTGKPTDYDPTSDAAPCRVGQRRGKPGQESALASGSPTFSADLRRQAHDRSCAWRGLRAAPSQTLFDGRRIGFALALL
jgi:hypothetical protein